MSKHAARYAVTFGLAGCYLPDTHSGPYVTLTRRELATMIRDELECHDMPASLFRDVHIARLWSHIRRHGSSSAHFNLAHKGYALGFHGLTEAEAEEMDKANGC